VALGPSLIAQLSFMRGVELIGPGRAGIFVNLVPIFGALLSVVILGETFGFYHASALTLVIGGILLAEQRTHAQK
jgi:drug/metabolite transporter (DMT)-like permease